MRTSVLPLPVRGNFKADCLPVMIGALAALLTVLFAYAPWSLAFLAGLVILALSAYESEPFLLIVIFLTPIGWVLGKTEALFSAFPARSNVDAALLIRCLVIVGFLAGRLWRGELRVRELLRPLLAKASLGFALAILVSALLSAPDLRAVSLLRASLRVTAYLGFFFVIFLWCRSSMLRVKKVAAVLLFSALVTALFAIVQFLVGGYTAVWYFLYPVGSDTFPWDSRSTSFLDYPNDLAAYLNLILPFALACYATRRSSWKHLGALTFVLGTIALFCTQSRGGVAAFLCMLVAGLYFLSSSLRARVFVLCAATMIAGLVCFFWYDIHSGRLGLDDLSSGATRLYLWSVAEQLFLSSPLHGVGWGNFQVLYSDFLDSSLVGESQLGVHNMYLALLAEMGILGLSSFLLLIVLAFRHASRLLRVSGDPFLRALGFGVAGGIVALFVQGFVEFQVAFTQFGILLWILLALLVVASRWQGGLAT